MILLYSPKISSRTEYVAGLLLGNLLGVEWKLTNVVQEYASFKGPKINYSKSPLNKSGLHIPAHGFLLERGVHYFLPELDHKGKLPLLFPVQGAHYDCSFDPFAATFYLVSRYEEYLPHKKDAHGRFEAPESFAYKNNFLNQAVVNHYAAMIKSLLQKKYPDYNYPSKKFSFLPTYDIDIAFAYKGRSMLRNVLGMLRSTWQLDFRSLIQRCRVLLWQEKDPFDTYEEQLSLYKQSGIKAHYFLLCGDYGPYDKNLAFFSRELFALVKKLGDYAHIGIHPSYRSNEEEGMLKTELSRLSGILNQDIQCSRQHYLRLSLPHTYQNLLKHNITCDFTMGYASQPGFRASICSPYPFYDLEAEKETPLTIVPFALMDGTLRDYLGLSPEEAFPVIRELIEEVERVNGTFSTLWHNDALCDAGDWQGWKKVYLKLYQMAVEKERKANGQKGET